MEHDPRIPLLDTIDMEILMHRDAHFGGNFPIMIDYYEQEGVGAMPDFDIEQLHYLMDIEQKLDINLAKELLPDQAKQKIAECRQLYKELRSLYDKKEASPVAKAIADLLLAESEYPKEEIEALCRHKEQAYQPLIDLLTSSTFDDLLSPGYGRGPQLAAICLGKIADPRSIPSLFDSFGRHDFACDEAIVDALKALEETSQPFLLKRLAHKPITKENENAACILSQLSEDAVVAHIALELLEDPEIQKHSTLATYLVFICSNLSTHEERSRFIELLNSSLLNNEIKYEINSIKKIWVK